MDNLKNASDFHKDILQMLNAENMLVKAMPGMIALASSNSLKLLIAAHLAETRQHAAAVHFIAKQLSLEINEEENADLQKIMDDMDIPGDISDDQIISTARKIEEFEIAGYNSAASKALSAGNKFVASKLYAIMEEEQQANTKLTYLQNHKLALELS